MTPGLAETTITLERYTHMWNDYWLRPFITRH